MATVTSAGAGTPDAAHGRTGSAGRGGNRPARADSERLFNRVTLGALIALALLWLLPLAWAGATSIRPPGELATDPTSWIADNPTLANYREVLAGGRIPYWYVNSFITAALTTLLTVGTASLAAFALSRLNFRYRRPVFLLILAGVMIPPQLLMIPHFLTLQATGMLNTYWAVILPQVPNVVAVFVFKQFFDGIPSELTDAARADGASWLRVYAQIVMPLSRPAVSAVTIFVFVWTWNNFLWPLLAVTDPQMMTLPVGLTSVQDAFGLPQAQLMASAVLGALPLLTVFLFFQRRIVEGIAGTGLK